MDRDRAFKFTTQFLNYWGIDPNQHRLNAWAELLEPLNDTAVRYTADTLRRSGRDRAPSPAEFHNAYQATRKRQPGPDCPDCHGNGWVSVTADTHPDHWPGPPDRCPPDWWYTTDTGETVHGCDCGVATPCHCTIGELAKDVHGRISRKRTALQQ